MAPPTTFPSFNFSLDMFNGINSLLFQQSLQDLVKGIRAHRRDEEKFIRTKLTEITEECRSAEITKKTNAILKLTYLQMMGYNVAFARFHVVEVISSPDFANKRIGYLAAAQSFSPTTDVLLLTTNQFKKDLTNGKLQNCSQALTCLAKIITEELGRDLENDVSLLLASPDPYIRKKALLVLYRLIMVHPDTLPIISSRFRERLTDPDPSVLCAAVTVTTELARTSPSTFLPLAPLLYQLLMNKESNNWMLIKIVKLMGVLTPLEPRLSKKLLEPLLSLMRTTKAKSLLYECCSTVTSGLLDYPEAVELCATRLSEFMDEQDQNLKYLGLLSMRKLIQVHPHIATEHRDNILDCLGDDDVGIRMRALELVSEFISKRNLRDISRILLRKLRLVSKDSFIIQESSNSSSNNIGSASNLMNSINRTTSTSLDQQAPYCEALAKLLLNAGIYKRPSGTFKGGYEMLSTADDFAWYLTFILGGLSEISILPISVRNTIADQLLELTSRVEAIRPVSVKVALSLLSLKSKEEDVATSTSASKTEATTEDEIEDNESNEDDADVESEDDDDDEENDDDEDNDIKTTQNDNEADSTSNPIQRVQSEESEEPSKTKVVKSRPKKAKVNGHDENVSTDRILSATLAGNTAWVLGEYAELIDDYVSVINKLVGFPKRGLDSAAQVRILTACIKVFVTSSEEQAGIVLETVCDYVSSLINSPYEEVQDRAWFFNSMLTAIGVEDRSEMQALFSGKLIPVDPRAQSKVPVPEDLDIDTPLLDMGNDSIVSYLMKQSGQKDEPDSEVVEGSMVSVDYERIHGEGDGLEDDDEGDDLFKEAVFSNATFSNNPSNPNNVYGTGLSKDRDANSPFYLNGLDSASSSGGRANAKGSRKKISSVKQQLHMQLVRKQHVDEERTAARFGYESGRLSSETAVVIEEDNSLGVTISDEETAEQTKSKLESRLQEAFLLPKNVSRGGSTAPVDVGGKGMVVGKKDKKKKKKKKKKEASSSIKPKTEQQLVIEQGSLIDFDDVVSSTVTKASSDNPTAAPQQPKHVAADELLS